MTDIKQMRADLHKKFNDLIQLEMLVNNYRDTKQIQLDSLKKIAIYGVSRGAVKYIETLVECIQMENPIDENDEND
jgi:hypothetical protein